MAGSELKSNATIDNIDRDISKFEDIVVVRREDEGKKSLFSCTEASEPQPSCSKQSDREVIINSSFSDISFSSENSSSPKEKSTSKKSDRQILEEIMSIMNESKSKKRPSKHKKYSKSKQFQSRKDLSDISSSDLSEVDEREKRRKKHDDERRKKRHSTPKYNYETSSQTDSSKYSDVEKEYGEYREYLQDYLPPYDYYGETHEAPYYGKAKSHYRSSRYSSRNSRRSRSVYDDLLKVYKINQMNMHYYKKYMYKVMNAIRKMS